MINNWAIGNIRAVLGLTNARSQPSSAPPPHDSSMTVPGLMRVTKQDISRSCPHVWLCDVNGVLIDSTEIVRQAFAATAAHYRCQFGEHALRRVQGLCLLEAYRFLDRGGDPFERQRYHLGFVRERAREIRAYPAVHDQLEAARATGIGIGAVTSYGAIAEECLVNTGLCPLIDHLVTREEVRRPKPHPEPIVRVLRLFNVEPRSHESRQVVYVGDTAVDIQAGRSAGVQTVGVTYGMADLAAVEAAEPDQVIDSFREMRRFLQSCRRPGLPVVTAARQEAALPDRPNVY
jgi:pyrophosphatase PpaX